MSWICTLGHPLAGYDPLVPWWGWVVAALATITGLCILFRRPLRYGMKVAAALTRDQRLPRPLRWALRVALAIKVVPFPDLGIDEVILAVIGVLLVTVYRPTFRAILAESKLTPPDER